MSSAKKRSAPVDPKITHEHLLLSKSVGMRFLHGKKSFVPERRMSQKKQWRDASFEPEVSWVHSSDMSPESNVIGVGAGYRLKNGKLPRRGARDVCLTFFVTRKHPKGRVPKRFLIAPDYDGIETDVVEVGIPRMLSGNAPGANPSFGLCPGSSIGTIAHGNHKITGTLGAFVKDDAEKVYILSNSHVIADDGHLVAGHVIAFPSPEESAEVIPVARFSSTVALLPFPQFNQLDCAIAEVGPLPPQLTVSNIIRGFGKMEGVGIAQAGRTVIKLGRSDETPRVGVVAQPSVQMYFSYPHGMRMFSGLMSIVGTQGPFAVDGDSGSLIVDRQSRKAVGLLTSGASGIIFANHLSSVLGALKVGLVS